MSERVINILELYSDKFISGFSLTMQILFWSVVCGFVLAWAIAIAQCSLKGYSKKIIGTLLSGFEIFFTGTPLLVQLFMVYYGLAQFQFIQQSWAWTYLREPLFCAILTCSLNTAAYSSVIFRGSVKTLHHSIWEACDALGISRARAWVLVIWPLAMQRSLPAYGNELIFLLQATAVVSVLPIIDITGVAKIAQKVTLSSESYYIAIVLYIAISAVIAGSIKYLTIRYKHVS